MPLIESKPDALARVYASSLFELAQESGVSAEDIQGELEDILEMARENRTFGEFLSSRVIDGKRRDASLTSILDGKASELTVKFLRLLNDKGRLGHLVAITAAMDELVQEAFGRVEVDVFTAEPMSPDELENVKSRLAEALGKQPIVHPYTDSSMIGGLKLRIGDQLIDGSVQAQLRQLKDQLSSGGAANLRGRFGEILEDQSN